MIGPWPSPPPFTADALAALWLDGSLDSTVAAHLLDRAGRQWLGLVPAGAPVEAMATAAALGAPTVALPAAGPMPRLSAWAAASEAASGAGARWLVTGLSESPGEPPLPLRILAIETAVRAHGLEGVYAPLLGYAPIELGRLALALGVPFDRTRDCQAACGDCEACRRRALMFRQLGMADPSAPNS